MKHRDQDHLLMFSIFVLCSAALYYCTLITLAFLAAKGTTFKDFDGPAWTQAIGSLIAIGVAIWLPYRQRERDRCEERARSLSETLTASRIVMQDLFGPIDLAEELHLSFCTSESALKKVFDPHTIPRCREASDDLTAACRLPLRNTGAGMVLRDLRDLFRRLTQYVVEMHRWYSDADAVLQCRTEAEQVIETIRKRVLLIAEMQTKLEADLAAAEALCR